MNYTIIKKADIKPYRRPTRGRGNIKFPEFLELEMSASGDQADCAIYPDTPYNREQIVKGVYMANGSAGQFANKRFLHWFETIDGRPSIVVQRIQ